MPIDFNCDADFSESLDEVKALIVRASELNEEERLYATFNKAAILLLTAKLETFFETLLEQFVYVVVQLQLPPSELPVELLVHHSSKALATLENQINKRQFLALRGLFEQLTEVWRPDSPCSDLSIDCSFSYGKHGARAVIKMFQRIGIEDIFGEAVVTEELDDTLTADQQRTIDMKGLFNSLTAIRNNIIHEDATPQLTHKEINQWALNFERFGKAISERMREMLESLDEGD